jgi:hypothetical protein
VPNTYGRGAGQYRTPAQKEMAERSEERNKRTAQSESVKRAIAARRQELEEQSKFFGDKVKVKR